MAGSLPLFDTLVKLYGGKIKDSLGISDPNDSQQIGDFNQSNVAMVAPKEPAMSQQSKPTTTKTTPTSFKSAANMETEEKTPSSLMSLADKLQYIGAGLKQMGGDPSMAVYLDKQAKNKQNEAYKMLMDKKKLGLEERQMLETIRHNKATESASMSSIRARSIGSKDKPILPSEKFVRETYDDMSSGWFGLPRSTSTAMNMAKKEIDPVVNILNSYKNGGIQNTTPTAQQYNEQQIAGEPQVRILVNGKPKLVAQSRLEEALSAGAKRI